MRWRLILILLLAIITVGLEQKPASAQIFPGIAPACGGYGYQQGYRPFHFFPRRYRGRRWRRCRCRVVRRIAHPCAPAYVNPCMPVPAAPVIRYRRQAYYERVPVTVYRRQVIRVPQTVYRNVLRYRVVPHHARIPRRRIAPHWTPGAYGMVPPVPAYTGGCVGCGQTPYSAQPVYPGVQPMPGTPVYPGMAPTVVPAQPGLTVPSVPNMGTPTPVTPDKKVPAPTGHSSFQPSLPGSQSSYTPWQTVPTLQGNSYFEQSDSTDGYRTLPSIPSTANSNSKFIPVPAGAAVQRTFR